MLSSGQTMPRFSLAAFAIVALATLGGCSKTADTPLVADFRRFCVDTRLQPNAIETAATNAGATRNSVSPRSSQNWDHAVGGRHITLRLAMAADVGAGSAASTICTVSDDQDGGASLAPIRTWVGAPVSDGNFEQYYFTLAGTQPRYVPRETLAPVRARTLGGGLYRLSIASFNGSTALTLQN
jgi:hypothetical protein